MTSRKALLTQGALLVGALLLLWLAVRNVSLREVASALRSLSARDIALLVALNLGAWMLAAWRWWLILLGFGHRLPWLQVFRYRITVFGLSYITPGPQVGGEVLQVYYPTARNGVPAAVSLAAAAVDKSLEFLGNFTFMAVGLTLALWRQPIVGEASLLGLLLLLALLLVPVGLLAAIWRGRKPFSAIVGWVARLLTPQRRVRLRRLPALRTAPRFQRFQQTTVHTEELIHWLAHHRPWVFASTMLVTLLAQITFAGEFWVMNRLLGIAIDPLSAISALTLVYFGFLLPVPGGLGAMEAALVTGYTALGFTATQALSQALLMRVRDITIAAIGLAMGGVDLRRSVSRPPPPGSIPGPDDLPAGAAAPTGAISPSERLAPADAHRPSLSREH